MKNVTFTVGLVVLFIVIGNLAVAQTDLSKASLLVSPAIQSPVRETVIQMVQEEVFKRTQIQLPIAGDWKGSMVIAVALSSDKQLYGRPVPETAKEAKLAEGFQVIQTNDGGRQTLWLIAADSRGAVFAAGYLLRMAVMAKNKIVFDNKFQVATAPEYPLRGHQLGYRTTANTYDAWSKEQYEQYIRELAIFGTNSIETIPFHELDNLPPLMKERPEVMNRFISDVCRRYDMEYWIWTPLEGDLSDPVYYASEIKRHVDFYKTCPRIDGVFIPGGDPGHNHPKYVLPFLKDIAAELKKYHPGGGVWLSLQGFSAEQVDYFFQYIQKEDPAWFTGVVSGPSSPSMPDTRSRLPKKYKHRHYPDITHTVRCEFPTQNWDQAFALTLGREPINPEPYYYAEIHNRFAPVTDGFLTYSDGSHDDVNKIVWSMCGWDTKADVNGILEQYVRFFFGAQPSDHVAEAVLGLANNWNGPVERNGGIEMTFVRWQQLEKAYPQLQNNWRWQMLVLRAYYDTYVCRRKIYEQGLEKEANRILAQAAEMGVEKAMQQALDKVNEADRINPSATLRQKIVDYCDMLFRSIGLQTSVEKYGAARGERGCVLDYVDYPLNNRWWIADEFEKIRGMKTVEEQLAALEVIYTWENPGNGSYYDNISNIGQSPHLVTKSLYDACDVAWWNNGKSRKRLSTQLFQMSPVLVYNGLDPNGRYIIRIAGEGDALLRVNGQRISPLIYNKELETFKEFLIDRNFVANGTMTVTFDIPEESHINWRRQSKICDVWLLKQPDVMAGAGDNEKAGHSGASNQTAVLLSTANSALKMPVRDMPYKMPESVKYTVNPKWAGVPFKKVVVDGDNNVYVLTDKGLYRDFPGGILSKDLLYSSLADKTPVDICIQETTGYLFYLYPDRFLTNAFAGAVCGRLPSGRYTRMAVNADGQVLLAGDTDAVLYQGSEKKTDIALPAGKEKNIRLYVHDRSFWYLTVGAVFRLEANKWKEIHRGGSLTSLAFSGKSIAVGTTDGYYVIDHSGRVIEEKKNRLPVSGITGLLYVGDFESNGDRLWFASDTGVFVKDGDKFRYYASQRWLDEDRIIDMAADQEGNIYALTQNGLNKIDFRKTSMLAKAEHIQENLRKYHYRYGFSNEATLLDPNDPTSLRLNDTDNDGLWTIFWFGSQVFRYLTTGSEEAKQYVWESFEAYERLISIHHIPGFSARTFERAGFQVHDRDRWRPAKDPDWVWKGTTSTDEYVAYIFVAALLDRFIAKTPQEKKRVADYFDAIMTHIITNNYYFIDADGEPTLWGRWNAEYVNSFAKTQFDRRLNSCLTVAGLQLAYKLTGKELYKTEAFRVMDEWGYYENMKIPMKNIAYTSGFFHKGISLGADWNHSDDEMAFPTYWVLYHYALNDTLRQTYVDITRDHWEIEKPERNGLWNLMTYAITGDIDLESTLWYLKEYPVDCRRYAVVNSHRKDLAFLPEDVHTNFREQSTTWLLPKGERPMNRHNANEFDIDSRRGGNSILAGDEYLLPYWLARYLKVIE